MEYHIGLYGGLQIHSIASHSDDTNMFTVIIKYDVVDDLAALYRFGRLHEQTLITVKNNSNEYTENQAKEG